MGYQWDSMRYYWDIDVILMINVIQWGMLGFLGISIGCQWDLLAYGFSYE